jgi:subtilisin family serine protease
MFRVRFGGRRGTVQRLAESREYVVVRTADRSPLERTVLSRASREALRAFEPVVRFAEAGVEIFRAREAPRGTRLRDRARAALKKDRRVRFAGRVLCDPRSRTPVLYTENLFVKFDDDIAASRAKRTLRAHGLVPKREIEYARNAWFVAAKEGTGQKVFAIAERLLGNASVELCHPELIRKARRRAAFPQQWHLKPTTVNGQAINAHANVVSAWSLTRGEGTVIAVIDDGFDLAHEEFTSSGKIVAPRDATRRTDNPRPGSGDMHGHSCAGVACADGRFGASGVAPAARLMPIRLASGLGSQNEADAFHWAAQHGADVISCSWGPADGDFQDPSDPVHREVVALPDSTRLAIDWALRNGRNGKGCVIVWAAGNGNESVDNDGYAANPEVIAVAACNDSSKKSDYSDFGNAVWCAFPSSDLTTGRTPGIWTTDLSGPAGYNPGDARRGDAAGNYTNDFGGTSSAAPGAAGVAALVLARNPDLRWDEVRDVLKRCCDRIDTAGGKYDPAGHSRFYGHGRLNARRAVDLAVPAQADHVAIRTARQDVPIADLGTARLSVAVADSDTLKSVRVKVDIDHTYIGDLVVSVKPPAALGLGSIILHNRTGGGADNIKKTYDAINAPGLAALAGKKPQGTWTLVVQDKEAQDKGTLRGFTVEMTS